MAESKDKFHPEFSKLFDAFEVDCSKKRSKAIATWSEVSERFSYHLFDGVTELLKKLRNRQCRLHLWTARDERSARAILADHGIDSLFTTMSFATVVDSKPHGSSLKFDWRFTDRNSVVVIGDSSSDVIGSKNIQAVSVAALWDPHVQAHSLVSSGAELFFYSMSELENWLDEKVVGRG